MMTKEQQINFSWTFEELNKWAELKLIPLHLFDSQKKAELHEYLIENKEMLYKHYHRNFDEDHFFITMPPRSEMVNAPDLQVIDKRNGEVVNTLFMVADYSLCEGICLKIRAKEKTEWEKETAEAKNLNKEQQTYLKSFIQKCGKERPLTRKEIVTFLEEIRAPKKNKMFRQSRELIDNKLDRAIRQNQLILLDEVDDKPTIKGLDLDQAEDRIVHTLTLLLSRKSENKNQKSNNYYMGNYEKGLISINQIEMETARIVVSPHEFYSTYYGKEDYNSDHVQFVLGKLDSLSKKTFLTTWKFQKETKEKKKRYDLFRISCPLFQIAILNTDLSESECQEIVKNELLLEGKRCQFLFKFQPQFTNWIRERYVEFPEDIYFRITEEVGKDRYGHHINLMRDFLFREKQVGRYDILRDKETIINILKLDKFGKEGRKKKVNDMIDEAVNVFIRIGLLIGWEKTKGKLDQDQYKIQINKEFK